MAQQVPDLDYRPALAAPAYPAASGPRIVIDTGRHNFHTVDGRYQPFAHAIAHA